MGENSNKTGDKRPHFETPEEVLAYLNEEAERTIHSWADLYEGLKAAFAAYREHPCRDTADYTVFLLHCWVLALEDLPEEGDALVIAKRMNTIMALQSERTGVAFLVGAELQAREAEERKTAEMAVQAIGELREILSKRLSSVTPPDDKKRTLH